MIKTKPTSLNEILNFLNSNRTHLESDFKTKIVGIFGSVVRGEAKKSSDIDILVQPQKGATLIEFIGLGNYLKKAFGKKVDMVSETALKERVKEYIYKDLVRL